MERAFIPYLLTGLAILLSLSIAAYVVLRSRALTEEGQKRRDNQAERERLAEQRMAENGGLPLSAPTTSTSKTSTKPTHFPELSEDAIYPSRSRRPNAPAGANNWR